jgi:hypothetical protein
VVVLVGLVATIGLASEALASILSTFLPSVLAKVIAGGTIASTGGAFWAVKRRRNRRNRATIIASEASTTLLPPPKTPATNSPESDVQ